MGEMTTIGIDLAKRVFQVQATGPDGKTILCRQLRRARMLKDFARFAPSLIGIEACSGARCRTRELNGQGHTLCLMPPNRMSSAARPMPLTLSRFVRPSPGPTCALSPSNPRRSRRCR